MEETKVEISKKEKKYINNIKRLRNVIFLKLQNKVTPFEMLSLSDEELQEKMFLTRFELLKLAGRVFKFGTATRAGLRRATAIFDGNKDLMSMQSRYQLSNEIKDMLVKKLLCYGNSTNLDEPSLLQYHIGSIPSVRQAYIFKVIRIEIEKDFKQSIYETAVIKKQIQNYFALDMFNDAHRQLWDSKIEYDFKKIYHALKYQKQNLLN